VCYISVDRSTFNTTGGKEAESEVTASVGTWNYRTSRFGSSQHRTDRAIAGPRLELPDCS